ncbi:alpha-l-fucosidase [Nesidiocoris tenuis]|uniref:alpha-L-fucosidase n=1 Tax=Nesidiocoris tenuis TaxID=355587 RepID=A0ABN7B2I0_9HEMI|nr:alpha-l-fucosidase [Nesidiocoris tenuis]
MQCWIFAIMVALAMSDASNDILTVELPPDNVVNDSSKTGPYKPTWDSLDRRPLPSWYDDGKVGIFIHWGVYAVPSYTSEWFWINWKGNPSPSESQKKLIEAYMKKNYKPEFSYQDFAKDFTAEFFNATQWAEIIENSGARYVILTSKHHEGYALWPSKYSYSWNSMDVGPHRDIVGELRRAIASKKKVKFGLYHSLYEWFHPLYLADKEANWKTDQFVKNKIMPEMKELVNNYKPDVFWSDGEWEAPTEYWHSREFLAWLYNESPVQKTVVVNDRWGHETLCKHGGVYTCQDRYNPGVLQLHKWENVLTIDKKTWGFNRASNLQDYMTAQELIDQIASTVSCGGNIVMNVGPAKDGTISPIFQDRLNEVGKWLKVNGEAIYGSNPWDNCQNDTVASDVWYTVNKNGVDLYVIMLRWPKTGEIELGCPELTKTSQVTMIGLPKTKLQAKYENHLLKIKLPDKALAPSDWGSVLKITDYKAI